MNEKSQMSDYLQSNSLGIGFQELCDYVINKNNCVLCGACASLCPRISINEKKPTLLEYDPECSMCVLYCARTFFPEDKFTNEVFGDHAQKDFLLGYYQKITVAKSNDDAVLKVAQNGGVVSSLLIHALNTGLIDGILLIDKDDNWFPKPVIARTPEDVLNFAGSKYTITPTLITYKDAVEEHKLKRLAFVGLPCQIQAARKLQIYPPLSDEYGKFKLIIGLYCFSNYSYQSLKEMVKDKLNISMNEVSKFDVSQGKLIIYAKGGSIDKIPIKDTKKYKWASCQYCKDYTAELADISVGSVGAPSGWNSVILRTDLGLKLFNDAVDSKKLITADTIDLTKIKKDSITKKSQLALMDDRTLNAMQFLDVSDFAIKTYATLISLGHANISILSKAMNVEKTDVLNTLTALKKREWVILNDGIYSPVNPIQVIKNEIYRLRKEFENKIQRLKTDALMDLNTRFIQNNFRKIRFKEFFDQIY